MATLSAALFSATLGFVGGIGATIIIERLKAGVASLEAEFVRLDGFEDDLFDVLEWPADESDRTAMLRRLNVCRRRLGQNVRRKVSDSVAYQACKAELVKLDGFVARAEDAEPLTDDFEVEIQSTVSALRRHLRRSSRTARAFAFLRGDA